MLHLCVHAHETLKLPSEVFQLTGLCVCEVSNVRLCVWQVQRRLTTQLRGHRSKVSTAIHVPGLGSHQHQPYNGTVSKQTQGGSLLACNVCLCAELGCLPVFERLPWIISEAREAQ